jgi:hypothetical protein
VSRKEWYRGPGRFAHAFSVVPGQDPYPWISLCGNVEATAEWRPASPRDIERREFCATCAARAGAAKLQKTQEKRRVEGLFDWWNARKRRFTAAEQALHDQERCVTCGQPVRVNVYGDQRRVPFECWECRQPAALGGRRRGFGALQVAQEYRRRLGYSTGASGAEKPDKDE